MDDKERVVNRLSDDLKKYTVTYRNEFYADITAKSREEAIKQFKSGKADYKLYGDLWEDFVECEEI